MHAAPILNPEEQMPESHDMNYYNGSIGYN
jgi:hypothetical protein